MAPSPYRGPIGWPFLPVLQGGAMSFPTLDESVRDAIRIILMTNPGEQLMTPTFGAGLRTFLDDGNTVAVRRQIQTAILESLQLFENRITVDAVDVAAVDGAASEIHVQIHYRVLRTNTSGQISATLQAG